MINMKEYEIFQSDNHEYNNIVNTPVSTGKFYLLK